jgi:putative ABC transport system permease protein
MSWLDAARTRAHLLVSRGTNESRTNEEFRFHLDMETDRLVRDAGLSRDEARRRALAAFGGVQNHRESMRDGRGLAWLSGLSLDFKLGFRMLVKYPGLTVIGGLAMAFGIWFGAVTIQMFGMIVNPTLPLPDGDRIVKVQNSDAKTRKDEDRVLYDYQLWRSARSITDLGAYRDVSVNVVGADGATKSEAAAEITASAFRIAPERPLLGRVLAQSDERAGAAPVVVLGHDLWAERFGRDPQVVGRSVKIGTGFATVVGVMPEGFAFPIAHELWLPLRTDVAGVQPRSGFPITVFGRLAPGMSFENARAELTALGKRLAADHPTTHAQLQPHVIPYAQMAIDDNEMTQAKALSTLFVVALVMVVCSTVALLLFARAASRETEILVRSALGASRMRIVAQLFAEALVLAGVAAVVGLAAAQVTLTRWGKAYLMMGFETQRLPFWLDFNLSPTTILFALVLAAIGAVVAGVMPARKITRGLGTRLRAGTAGGGGVSFGGVWTAVIIVQVALTVALPSVVMLVRGETRRVESYDFGFPAQEYLGVTLGVDGTADAAMGTQAFAARGARLGTSIEALRQRLEAEPGVAGVTVVDRLPGEHHAYRRVEVSVPGSIPSSVATAWIHPSYFDVMQAPVRTGRAFTIADRSLDSRVVIVDQAFVDSVMFGRNPIGHRVRLVSSAQLDSNMAQLPWYEIIGVAKDLGMSAISMPQRWPGVYLPFVPGSQGSAEMIVHTRGDPMALASRVRELATTVDASLQVVKVTRLDQVAAPLLWLQGVWTRIIAGLTGIALLLSLSGIYAVLSYIVARRTREIGVRVALGAGARRVITSIFRRPLAQVTLGVVAGAVLIGFAAVGVAKTEQFAGTGIGGLTLGDVPLLVGYAILMLGVCTLACLVPTRRALRVQPTEALRTE